MSQKSLNKHNRIIHMIFKETRYECSYEQCKESFSSKRNLKYHQAKHKRKTQTVAGGDLMSGKKNIHYKCYNCHLIFYKKKELITHMRLHNNLHKRLLCPIKECKDMFNRYTLLRSHLKDCHNLSIEQENYEFETLTEFNKWKKEKEEALKVNYIQNSSKKKLKNRVVTYYECHRSLGSRLIENAKRHIKSTGTNKINRACPSTLTVTFNSEKVSVVFYSRHIGHAKEIGRLRLNQDERHRIAGKLSQGVTVERVLSDIRDDALKNGRRDRIHLIEKKDIHNIICDYSIGYSTKRHQCDAVSVKLWVDAMRELDNNPILCFKEQVMDYKAI
ncbi:hypothetical protein ABEB36_007430 [Hypothenemus hampei]|uniref:C2H2-type domain-containing protein n=1 Tax=Hypothenemus hampei TaxID=57062 RepID=A0ABD1ETY1_HYPHA